MAQLFKQENDALLELQWYNAGEYHRTNGMWCGGECIPGVSWSRDDFVDNLMLWWGDAVVEEVGKFRYRPNFMDKGGLVLDIGGAWTSVQSKEIWAQSMMCMLSSIMCGIPGEIAALLPASDPFWDFIVDKEGPEVVRLQRAKIREARNRRFNVSWQEQRFRKLHGDCTMFQPSLPSSEGTSESSRPRGGVLENEAPGGPQRGQEGPGRASTIVEEMKSSKKKSKDTTEKPGTPMRPPVVVATSRTTDPSAYPSSVCTDSTAPSASEARDVREYSGVVTAAIDYDHAEEGVARMRRGERFHCKRQTKNLFLGYKEGSKELLWLPKFVVTGDLTTLRRE
ncbi:hypothetical protein Pmar_PMAR019653 [Perkinsus marinus ATCC 50983]|uniref:Uncharacterized protein n=1 Tax=Perkinsus marinus (strain ATCC 50983 / TXsc) TaxID=423536 RepID=C5LFA4_PERM5|nr:hypothetical protein Pmar_PMAR019653 [Perkinsus marinus ATCC 50983]EER04619.1 hypothetical protein Pmar_PMAR019653 [Perkinsus marinus ATCC 50983]|eukprot:XP_002772803.1 hypothetical protein Pmar_PMAR019653 [Perkinsus marinus ATCC 50983]